MPLSKNYELGTLANTLDIDQSTGEITSLTIDTDVVGEGANLYFTNERVDDRVAALIQAGTNITVAYDDVLGTLTISASDTEDDLSNNTTSDLAEGTNLYYTNARADARIAAASIDALSDVDITTAAPSSGQSLVWDNVNSKFIPGDSFSQSDFDTAFAAKSTTNLSEGTNLYYTDARADARIAAADTDALSEGSTNLYFTNARADARIAAATTTDLTEGTNLYYTDARADARAQLKIDALVDSAPNTLDTLNELASALGDDANFSTTITNSIATKLATADFNSTFDTRLGTKTTADLTEGTNLYYTDARADARIAAADTDDLSEGSTNLYFTNARADARIALQAGANLDLSSKSTSDLSEGTNLYYTNARVDAHLNQSNPTSGYVLSWNGSDYAWIDNTGYTAFNTDFDTRLGTKTTANLTEGSNLYYTNARADARVDAGFTAKSTSDLSEGTNLYYTNARADARIALQVGSNLDLSSKDTNSLSEGSNNLYYTNSRADARVNLQTGSNLNLSSKDTDDLSEGSNNLYFTNARVQGTTINAGSLRGSVNNATVQYGTSYSGTPAQGSFFFDSLNAKLKVYNGSAFVDAVPAGGGGGGGSGSSDANATFRKYTFDISSTTNSVSGKDSVVVTAGSFVTGYQYQIISVGNTDFTAIGASGNTVGVTFTATGVGSGTGTAGHVLNYATSNQNVEVYRNGAKMVEGSGDDYVATTGTSVNFTYNLQSGDVVEVQVYELLTNDAYYLKTETYTQTQTNSQISTAVAGYLPLSGGVLTDDLAINNGSPELYFGTTGNHYNWRIAAQEAVDAAFEIAVGSQDTDYSNDTYTPKLVVKSSGNVGIGTTGPTRLLSVSSDTTRTTGFEDITEFLTPSIGAGGSVSLNIGKANSTKNLGKMAFHYAGAGSNSNYLGFGFYDADNLMVVMADGKVGIGTTSPARPLHVQGEIYVNHNADNAGVKTSFRALHTSNNTIEIHQFGQSHSNGAVNQIGVSNAEQHLHLVTDSSANVNAGTSTKGIFLRSGGNVGIGTVSPSAKLHVNGNTKIGNYSSGPATGTAVTNSVLNVYASTNLGQSAGDELKLLSLSGHSGNQSALTFRQRRNAAGTNFFTDCFTIAQDVDNTEKTYEYMAFSDGNIGIGTDNPGTTMHLFNGTQARFAMQNPSRRFDLTADGDGFTIRDQSAAVNRFRIDTNGYAVLGSGSPTSSYGLEIQKSNAGAALYLHNKDVPGVTGASVYHAYQVTQTNGQSARLAEITATGTSGWGGELTFATKPANATPNNSATVRMKIEAGGNVGIGTTDPSTLLDVNGSSGGNGAPHNSGISVRSGFVAFRNNGTTFHEVIQGESNCMGIYNYNYNDGVLIYTNNADSNATPSFHPAYHFGGYNNADTETFGAGWANGDPIFTMARPGSKDTSKPAQGLSNSSNFTSIIKTATRTEFRDNQGQHYFHSTVVANNHLSAEADPGFWYRKNAGANAGNTRRAVVLNDGQLIFRAYTDYNHKMWYADGINLGTNQSHGHFRVFGENNTSRGATDQGQTHRFSVDTTSGNVGVSEGGTQIYNNSDERLKTNIVDLPDGALTKVNALRPVMYDWRYKTQNDKPYGFIAQEVQAVDNELVFTNGPTMYREDKTYGEGLEPDGTIEDTLGINERKLLPIYAKAIQELSDLVEQLQARIDSAGIE